MSQGSRCESRACVAILEARHLTAAGYKLASTVYWVSMKIVWRTLTITWRSRCCTESS